MVCDVVLERGGCVAVEEQVEGRLAEDLQLHLHAGEKRVQCVGKRQLVDAVRKSNLCQLPATPPPTHHICHQPATHACKHSSSAQAE